MVMGLLEMAWSSLEGPSMIRFLPQLFSRNSGTHYEVYS